jgi:hypothetical protein
MKAFWEISMDSININETAVFTQKPAVISAGFPLIFGPDEQVQTFYSKIPDSRALSDGLWASQYLQYLLVRQSSDCAS